MAKIADSRLKRTAGIIALIAIIGAIVFGANGFLTSKRNRNQPNASDTPVAQVTEPATQVAVLGAQTQLNGGYEVLTTGTTQEAGYIVVSVSVKNVSSSTLQLSPGLQFYVASTQTNATRAFVMPASQSALIGGPIASGDSVSGKLYFESLNEPYELRFIPEVGSTDFIIVDKM